MKRRLAWLLLAVMLLGALPVYAEGVVQEKMTKTDRRVAFYLEYLTELMDDDTKISYVGLADINKDKLPELFYVYTEDGESAFAFCGYDLDSYEVFEYDCEETYLGRSPKNLSLKRYNEIGTNNYCWYLRAQTAKKNDEKRFEYMAYMLKHSGTTLESKLRFHRTWLKGNKNMRYFINGNENVKSVYEDELDNYFGGVWKRAATTTFKNAGPIRKLAKQNAKSLRTAMNKVTVAWKDLTPMSE